MVEIVRQTDVIRMISHDIVSLAVSIETLKGVLIMKRIINGKVYNTETAEKVASWDNDLFVNDFGYMSDNLEGYNTKKVFFVGKTFLDNRGTTCFVNMFTLIFSRDERRKTTYEINR